MISLNPNMVWKIEKIKLPLKFDWAISRGSVSFKENFIVSVQAGDKKGQGEIAFNIRYGESLLLIEEQFQRFKEECSGMITSLEGLNDVLSRVELCNSLRFGIESAFIHFLSDFSGRNVHELLGISKVNSVITSFSIPIMSPDKIGPFIEQFNLKRFEHLKLKVSGENALDLLFELAKHHSGKIRIDANEGFESVDDVLRFFTKITPIAKQIEFIEQPLKSSDHEGMRELKSVSPFILIADESVESGDITPYIAERFHGVNIKLMKSGGYLKAVRQLKVARSLGMKTMLGCMVETSLGITSALNIAAEVNYLDLDGSLLLESDPFNLLHEENGRLFYSHLQ